MMDVKTLVSAATLKGYLMATHAPKAIVLLAEQIVEAATNDFSSEPQTFPRLRNEYVKLPEPVAELAEAITENSKTVPARDETRFAEPEPAHKEPEEAPDTEVADDGKHSPLTTPPERTIDREQIVPAILPEVDMRTARGRNPENIWEDWQIETLIRMKSAGAKTPAIALKLSKTPQQVSNKWAWLPNTVKKLKPAVDEEGWPEAGEPVRKTEVLAPDARQEAIDALLAEMPEANDLKSSTFTRDDIPRILQLLGDLPMSVVAERLGTQGYTVDKHLKRYGIDYRLLPAKSDRRTAMPDSKPMMKFKTVAIKDSWGNENEIQVPEPLEESTDPESGAPVTRYPPGYARGAFPQRNVSVKGGS